MGTLQGPTVVGQIKASYGNGVQRDETGKRVDIEDARGRDSGHLRIAPGLYAMRVSSDRRPFL